MSEVRFKRYERATEVDEIAPTPRIFPPGPLSPHDHYGEETIVDAYLKARLRELAQRPSIFPPDPPSPPPTRRQRFRWWVRDVRCRLAERLCGCSHHGDEW